VFFPEIIELSKKYIGKRVLDVSAGSGVLIDRLPTAMGLDLVPKHPKVIKKDISNMLCNVESFYSTNPLFHSGFYHSHYHLQPPQVENQQKST
jgi:hypothetical protein